MRRIFAVSVVVSQLSESGQDRMEHSALWMPCDSLEDAEAQAEYEAENVWFPADQGWYDHSINVMEIPPSAMRDCLMARDRAVEKGRGLRSQQVSRPPLGLVERELPPMSSSMRRQQMRDEGYVEIEERPSDRRITVYEEPGRRNYGYRGRS